MAREQASAATDRRLFAGGAANRLLQIAERADRATSRWIDIHPQIVFAADLQAFVGASSDAGGSAGRDRGQDDLWIAAASQDHRDRLRFSAIVIGGFNNCFHCQIKRGAGSGLSLPSVRPQSQRDEAIAAKNTIELMNRFVFAHVQFNPGAKGDYELHGEGCD